MEYFFVTLFVITGLIVGYLIFLPRDLGGTHVEANEDVNREKVLAAHSGEWEHRVRCIISGMETCKDRVTFLKAFAIERDELCGAWQVYAQLLVDGERFDWVSSLQDEWPDGVKHWAEGFIDATRKMLAHPSAELMRWVNQTQPDWAVAEWFDQDPETRLLVHTIRFRLLKDYNSLHWVQFTIDEPDGKSLPDIILANRAETLERLKELNLELFPYAL